MILLITFLLLLALYIYQRYRDMSILARNGIPGPTPNLIYGNIFSHNSKPNVIKFNEYFAKYGPVMGYYIGKKANVLVNDVELARRIQIKDFNKFSDRQTMGIKNGLHPNGRFFNHLINAKGAQWKELRTILNPTFSAMKLKTMTPIMVNCIDIMLNKVEKKAKTGEEFDIYEFFQLLTTDVIGKCALGVDTDVQNNPNEEFFVAAKRLFDLEPSKFLLMFTCFPELDRFLYPLRRGIEMIREYRGLSTPMVLSRLVNAAINLRKSSSTKKNDLLQLMLDAKVTEDVIESTSTANLTIDMNSEETSSVANGTKLSTEPKPPAASTGRNVKALSQDMIIATAMVFYEAGYETTSTSLGFVAHVLVNNPDIQEKVREEVVQLYKEEGKLDYNTVSKLSYMSQVINETLRYYPPVTTFVTRTANEDYHYNGMTIPKNSTVRIPIKQLHHSEELWPNHDQFDPERFRDKAAIDPVAFQPFGTGPRNCIGMRFALYEMKLALAKMLYSYRLVPGPSTEKELTIEYKVITETPKNGVFVRVVPIEH